jgi:dihydroorotase
LEEHGRPIAVGEPANLCLVDAGARWTVDPAQSASRSRNTPFAGHELPSRVVATFLRGRATVLEGAPA